MNKGDDGDVTPPDAPENAPLAALVAPEALRGGLVHPDVDRALEVYLEGQMSPRSKQNASEALKRLTRLVLRDENAVPSQIPWHAISFVQATGVRKVLFEATRAGLITPGTANLTLSHLRGLIRTMYGMGLVTVDQVKLLDTKGPLKSVPGKRTPRGRALTFDEEKKLRVAARELGGYRGAMLDTAIVLAVGGGLRREEVTNLTVAAFQSKTFSVLGKGNKERPIPIDADMRAVVDAWLEERVRLGVPHGVFFCSPQKPEWVLSPWSFWSLVRDAAHDAFGDETKCTRTCGCLKVVTGPHDFRRTCASRLLDRGFDLRQVQEFMGHESPETTARYDKRDIEALFEKRRNTKVLAQWDMTPLEQSVLEGRIG